jgi:hypothetical protein
MCASAKARRGMPSRSDWAEWAPLGQVYCLALAIIGSGIPLGMLGYWLAVGSSAAFPLAEISEALLSSLALSLGGAALCLVLAVPVGLLVVRYKGQLAMWAERLPYLLHALPGLVIALTLVYFALHYVPALYQTSALLLIAYALLFLPLAQAPIRTALEQGGTATGRGRAHAGGIVVQRVLPGDPADHLSGIGRGVRAGVPRCDEGADRDAAAQPDRVEHVGDGGVGAHLECGVRGGGALCGAVDSWCRGCRSTCSRRGCI